MFKTSIFPISYSIPFEYCIQLPKKTKVNLDRMVAQVDRLAAGEKDRWLDPLSYVHALVYHERGSTEIQGLQETIAASVASENSQKEVRNMRRTMAEVLHARDRKEGIVRGKQETLLRQLRQRFKAVPRLPRTRPS